MEHNGVSTFRNRESRSSERLLGLFCQHQPGNTDGDIAVTNANDELEEDEVFWTGHFSQSITPSNKINQNHYPITLRRSENSGIFSSLTEEDKNRSLGGRTVLCRKTSTSSSSSRMIPKSQTPQGREYSQSLPLGKFNQSDPVKVPVLPKAVSGAIDRNSKFSDVSDEDFDNDEMLPPHEIIARRSGRSATFSVLEGFGRTLKGRDLDRVRNAVWRKTGFLG